jgi:DNA sulfur modification protein DndD
VIIESVIISDFRSYYGEQRMRLNRGLDEEHNVVAIGGLNGAGKTTLIDAIAFALMGQAKAFEFVKKKQRKGDDKRVIEKELNSLINREAFAAGVREASVTLSITANEGKRYGIKRTWLFDHKGAFKSEEVVVTPLDGGKLGEEAKTPEELKTAFQDFLMNHVPPEIAGFFFFDGEEIQRIAEDEPEDAVRKGIESLLGFHLLDSLTSDMEKLEGEYLSAKRKESRQREELDRLRAEVRRCENDREELDEDQSKLERQAQTLRDESRRLATELGGDGRDPTTIQSELEDVVSSIKAGRLAMEGEIDRWITPALAGGLVRDLADQLGKEEVRAQWEEGKRRVEPQKERLITKLLGPDAPQTTPPLEEPQARFLTGRFREEWDHLFNPPPEGIAEVVRHHQLTQEDRSLARNRCLEILRSSAPDLSQRLAELDKLERRARDLRQMLADMGDREAAAKLVAQKGRVDRELGEIEARWEEKQRALKKIMVDLQTAKKNLNDKEAELRDSDESSHKVDFTRRVKQVIEEYKEALRPRKRDELQGYLTDMYRRLARKEDVVDRIELDDRTFAPRLLDRRGRQIPLNSQSAGEREIYALSLLWALARTSQRELPVIIDTPLARLDGAHRSNIVTRYLPHAGHQVIVLSTDTEIDRKHLHMIEKNIASSYRLEFDASSERTTVSEGYFDFE